MPKGASSSDGGASATATGDSAVITLTGGSSQPTYTEYTDVTAPTMGHDPMVCATDGSGTVSLKFSKTFVGWGFDDKASWADTVVSLSASGTGTGTFGSASVAILVNDAVTDGGAWLNGEGWTTLCPTLGGTSASLTFSTNDGTTVTGTYTATVRKANTWGASGCTGATSTFTGSFTATLAGSC